MRIRRVTASVVSLMRRSSVRSTLYGIFFRILIHQGPLINENVVEASHTAVEKRGPWLALNRVGCEPIDNVGTMFVTVLLVYEARSAYVERQGLLRRKRVPTVLSSPLSFSTRFIFISHNVHPTTGMRKRMCACRPWALSERGELRVRRSA